MTGVQTCALPISSKSPRRTDNDYSGCIEGFSEHFPKLKKVLRVKVQSVLCNGAGDLPFSPEGGLAVLTRIRNKRCKGSRADLLFYEVTDLKFALFDGWGKDTEMTISPMQDGRLFVQFGGELNFFCTRIALWKEP